MSPELSLPSYPLYALLMPSYVAALRQTPAERPAPPVLRVITPDSRLDPRPAAAAGLHRRIA
ncbi:MAG: hypothetical protein ACRYGM_21905 [Janthinobacterium lividum]